MSKKLHSVGSLDKGVVEVTNCFCVPHKEHDDQVEAELSYALDVYELNRRVNPSESIVGKCKNPGISRESLPCVIAALIILRRVF